MKVLSVLSFFLLNVICQLNFNFFDLGGRLVREALCERWHLHLVKKDGNRKLSTDIIGI